MTEDDTIARGNYVEALFRDETFDTLVAEFKRQQADAIVASEPHEVKKREAIYARVTGLQEFTEHLLSFVVLRKSIVERREAEIAILDEDAEDSI